jgi:hypothetical protein
MMRRDELIHPVPDRSSRPARRADRVVSEISKVAIVITALLFVALPKGALAQDFFAVVDRTEIAENETLNLEVVYADRADTSAIDFEKLLPEFTIIGNRPSSQTSIVNFKRASRTSWNLALMPRRTGRIRIPAFQIGNATTRPIEVNVSPALEGPEAGSPFSARLVADRESAFIGEQILIRILLTSARDVGDLRGSSLDLPGTETTLVNQSEFQRVIGGEPYQVTELAYAVFPQTAGPLSVPSIQYTASIRRSRGVIARTEARTIDILDPASDSAASQKRPWLPADAVAVASEWSGPDDVLHVGEPITRTIRIATASQRAAAISPISLPDGPYKQYSEQPILDDTETSTGILGRRTDSIVLVPTQPGELRLPAVEIDWWNIDERRWQVARLPEEILYVEAGAGTAPVDPVAPDASATGAIPPTGIEPDTPSLPRSTDSRLTIALGLLSAILLACCIALWVRVRRLEARARPVESDAGSSSEHATRVQTAFNRALRSLSKRDPNEARRDILSWARLQWPGFKITRLDEISDQTNDADLVRALASLDAELYRSGESPGAVDYDGLKDLLKKARSEINAKDPTERSTLTALYPSRS